MIASIDWVTLHQKFGFVLVVAAVLGALIGLMSLVTPLVGFALKIYLRLLLLAVALRWSSVDACTSWAIEPATSSTTCTAAAMAVTLGVTFAVGRRTPWPLSKLPLVIGAIVAGRLRGARTHFRLSEAANPAAGSGGRSSTTTLKRERMRIRPASTGAPRTATARALPSARKLSYTSEVVT